MSLQKAKVLFNYIASNPDELNLKTGEIILIHEIFDDHWIKGELNGAIGMIPENYIQILETPLSTSAAISTSTTTTTTVNTTVTINSSNSNISNKENNNNISGLSSSTTSKIPENYVLAVMDNESNSSGQLVFKKGDLIKVIEKFPTGWMKGECHGKVGVFKKELVTEDSNALGNIVQSSGTKAKVIYSYTAQQYGQISLEVGQDVIIYEENQQGWIKGECNGKVGIFPGSFVKRLENDGGSTPANATGPNVTGQPALPASGSAAGSGTEYVAIAPFKATQSGQISLEVGDTVVLVAKYQGGWWKGKHSGTGEEGVFPGTYVKEKSSESVSNQGSGSSAGFKAKVLHDYTPSGPNQLTLKVGNIINVTKELPKGWWFGELDGNSGRFPASYTKRIDDQNTTPQPSTNTKTLCVANYDFNGDGNKLSFAKGDKFYFIKELDKGWSSGEKDGKMGIFPTTYVTLLPSTTPSDPPTTQPPPASNSPDSSHSDELRPSLPPPSALSSNPRRAPPQVPPETSAGLPKPNNPEPPKANNIPDNTPKPLPTVPVKTTSGEHKPPTLPPPKTEPVPPANTSPVPPPPPPKPTSESPTTSTAGGSGPVPPPPKPPQPDQPKEPQPPKVQPAPKVEPAKVEKAPPPVSGLDNNELSKKIAARAKKIEEQEKEISNNPKPIEKITTTPAEPERPKLPPQQLSHPTHSDSLSPEKEPTQPARKFSGNRAPISSSNKSPRVSTTQTQTQVQTNQSQGHTHQSNEISPSSKGGDDELNKYKTAMTRLQAQTKVAVDNIMEMIHQQQRDNLKLVSVLREMKLEIIEEQKKTAQLGEQNRKLYTDLTTIQKFVNESRGGSLPSKQGVSSIQEELEIERQRRHDLESHVNKLQTEFDNLQRRLARLENQGFI